MHYTSVLTRTRSGNRSSGSIADIATRSLLAFEAQYESSAGHAVDQAILLEVVAELSDAVNLDLDGATWPH